jgi:hypothetical protein
MSLHFAVDSALQGLKLDEARHDLIRGGARRLLRSKLNDWVKKAFLKHIFQRIYFQRSQR